MPAHLHRTTVPASDARASAELVGRILGLSPAASPASPAPDGRLRAANDVTLEFTTTTAITPQRYAFVVTEDEFDAVYARLLDLRARTWADPERTRPAEIDHPPGGRGICFEDPDGHLVEILTHPPT